MDGMPGFGEFMSEMLGEGKRGEFAEALKAKKREAMQKKLRPLPFKFLVSEDFFPIPDLKPGMKLKLKTNIPSKYVIPTPEDVVEVLTVFNPPRVSDEDGRSLDQADFTTVFHDTERDTWVELSYDSRYFEKVE